MGDNMEKIKNLSFIKNVLEKENEKRPLSYEQRLALEHSQQFAKISVEISKKLIEELKKLERVSDVNAHKISDILPTHPDDISAIFAKERFNLEKEEVNEIIAIVAKYL